MELHNAGPRRDLFATLKGGNWLKDVSDEVAPDDELARMLPHCTISAFGCSEFCHESSGSRCAAGGRMLTAIRPPPKIPDGTLKRLRNRLFQWPTINTSLDYLYAIESLWRESSEVVCSQPWKLLSQRKGCTTGPEAFSQDDFERQSPLDRVFFVLAEWKRLRILLTRTRVDAEAVYGGAVRKRVYSVADAQGEEYSSILSDPLYHEDVTCIISMLVAYFPELMHASATLESLLLAQLPGSSRVGGHKSKHFLGRESLDADGKGHLVVNVLLNNSDLIPCMISRLMILSKIATLDAEIISDVQEECFQGTENDEDSLLTHHERFSIEGILKMDHTHRQLTFIATRQTLLRLTEISPFLGKQIRDGLIETWQMPSLVLKLTIEHIGDTHQLLSSMLPIQDVIDECESEPERTPGMIGDTVGDSRDAAFFQSAWLMPELKVPKAMLPQFFWNFLSSNSETRSSSNCKTCLERLWTIVLSRFVKLQRVSPECTTSDLIHILGEICEDGGPRGSEALDFPNVETEEDLRNITHLRVLLVREGTEMLRMICALIALGGFVLGPADISSICAVVAHMCRSLPAKCDVDIESPTNREEDHGMPSQCQRIYLEEVKAEFVVVGLCFTLLAGAQVCAASDWPGGGGGASKMAHALGNLDQCTRVLYETNCANVYFLDVSLHFRRKDVIMVLALLNDALCLCVAKEAGRDLSTASLTTFSSILRDTRESVKAVHYANTLCEVLSDVSREGLGWYGESLFCALFTEVLVVKEIMKIDAASYSRMSRGKASVESRDEDIKNISQRNLASLSLFSRLPPYDVLLHCLLLLFNQQAFSKQKIDMSQFVCSLIATGNMGRKGDLPAKKILPPQVVGIVVALAKQSHPSASFSSKIAEARDFASSHSGVAESKSSFYMAPVSEAFILTRLERVTDFLLHSDAVERRIVLTQLEKAPQGVMDETITGVLMALYVLQYVHQCRKTADSSGGLPIWPFRSYKLPWTMLCALVLGNGGEDGVFHCLGAKFISLCLLECPSATISESTNFERINLNSLSSAATVDCGTSNLVSPSGAERCRPPTEANRDSSTSGKIGLGIGYSSMGYSLTNVMPAELQDLFCLLPGAPTLNGQWQLLESAIKDVFADCAQALTGKGNAGQLEKAMLLLRNAKQKDISIATTTLDLAIWHILPIIVSSYEKSGDASESESCQISLYAKELIRTFAALIEDLYTTAWKRHATPELLLTRLVEFLEHQDFREHRIGCHSQSASHNSFKWSRTDDEIYERIVREPHLILCSTPRGVFRSPPLLRMLLQGIRSCLVSHRHLLEIRFGTVPNTDSLKWWKSVVSKAVSQHCDTNITNRSLFLENTLLALSRLADEGCVHRVRMLLGSLNACDIEGLTWMNVTRMSHVAVKNEADSRIPTSEGDADDQLASISLVEETFLIHALLEVCIDPLPVTASSHVTAKSYPLSNEEGGVLDPDGDLSLYASLQHPLNRGSDKEVPHVDMHVLGESEEDLHHIRHAIGSFLDKLFSERRLLLEVVLLQGVDSRAIPTLLDYVPYARQNAWKFLVHLLKTVEIGNHLLKLIYFSLSYLSHPLVSHGSDHQDRSEQTHMDNQPTSGRAQTRKHADSMKDEFKRVQRNIADAIADTLDSCLRGTAMPETDLEAFVVHVLPLIPQACLATGYASKRLTDIVKELLPPHGIYSDMGNESMNESLHQAAYFVVGRIEKEFNDKGRPRVFV